MDTVTQNSENSIKRIIPRKLNCSQFTSIKRLKSENNLSTQQSFAPFTDAIYRNLSIISERENEKTKKDPNRNKKLQFKGLNGRKLKNQYETEDNYYEETLEKQKELYSHQNIEKLQQEVIEMDIMKNNHDPNHNRNVSVLPSQNSMFSTSNPNFTQISISQRKLPPKAHQLPNYKRFKGNPYFHKAMQAKMAMKNKPIEFDLDFSSEKYTMDDEFDDSKFQLSCEKQQKEIQTLFESKKRPKRKITQKSKSKTTTKTRSNAKSTSNSRSRSRTASITITIAINISINI